MKLLEYEAKKLLSECDIPIPKATLLGPDTTTFPETPVVLKSQVPTGGRGKLGGVVVVESDNMIQDVVSRLFKKNISGFLPHRVLAEEKLDIKRELYLSLLVDRDTASIQCIASAEGGVEVEDNQSDAFLKVPFESKSAALVVGEQLAECYDLPAKTFVLQDMLGNLFDCFVKNDALLLEINPLIVTKDGQLVAGDCKMELDDAAHFRHQDWHFEYMNSSANFVSLDTNGSVATIANGAGLAMATVDAVVDGGLSAANFLDIGGGANEASVLAAFRQIMDYPHVSAIVINIFAGITRCDEVARAIIAAKDQIQNLPLLYISLAGTNYREAEQLLKDAGVPLLSSLEACIEKIKKDQA